VIEAMRDPTGRTVTAARRLRGDVARGAVDAVSYAGFCDELAHLRDV
jgi:hypothetical protein